mgnify:CR=1 FL=1
MRYPIHLGVTEAGNGLEGRIKSAVGIGALLADGIGVMPRQTNTTSAPLARMSCGCPGGWRRRACPSGRSISPGMETPLPSRPSSTWREGWEAQLLEHRRGALHLAREHVQAAAQPHHQMGSRRHRGDLRRKAAGHAPEGAGDGHRICPGAHGAHGRQRAQPVPSRRFSKGICSL